MQNRTLQIQCRSVYTELDCVDFIIFIYYTKFYYYTKLLFIIIPNEVSTAEKPFNQKITETLWLKYNT